MKRIETARLFIREYHLEDLSALHEILSDELTMSFWPKPFNYDQSEESDYWGQGFGFEAANALLIYGLTDLKLQRICANMPATHNASRRVAEKLGMKLDKQFLNSRNREILTCVYVK